MRRRVAVVDVGTNTTRLFIADVENRKILEQHTRISRVTRLGAGVDQTGVLGQEGLEREHAILAEYKRLIDEHQPDCATAIMTSAVRDAGNGDEFAGDVAQRYGFDVHVLSGDEEANLTYVGATDELSARCPGKVLVFDIGGGSTELIIGTDGHHIPDFHVSTQAGVVRQADRHITRDPPTAGEFKELAADVRATISAAVPTSRRNGIDLAIAVAGTPTSLAAIAQELDPYDPSKVHGYELSAAERDQIFARLKLMPLDERRQVTGLQYERATAILPGIVILKEVMDLFALDRVEVSEHDILRGAAVAYAPA